MFYPCHRNLCYCSLWKEEYEPGERRCLENHVEVMLSLILVKSVNSCSFFYLQISFFSATLLIYRLETGQTQSRTSSELRGVEPAWWYLPETLMSISPTICTPLHILFLIYFQALFTIYSSLLSLPFRGLSLKSSAGTKLMQVIKF